MTRYSLLRNRELMQRAIDNGWTTRMIAERLHCHRKTVREHLKRHRIDPRRGAPHEPH